MFKVKKPPPDARILKLRDYEDKLKSMQDRCKEQSHFSNVATWEAKTDTKLAKNSVLREFAKLRAERTRDLEARRQRLASKLYHEELALQQELMDSRITPEEKRASLAARAKGLWEAREAERQAEANSLLERHFRENSDSLRQEFSKKKDAYILDVRKRQVADRQMRAANELRKQAEVDEMDAFEGLKATMRGIMEKQKRYDDMHMVERTLDEQLREKHRRQAEEAERDAAELQAVMDYQAARAAEQQARDDAAAAKAKALSDAIRAYNEEKLVLDKVRSEQELEEDRQWMKDFLARERLQVQAEQQLKDRQQEELRRWMQALKDASRSEALDMADMEKAIEAYQNEQWARYDAQQQALADARAALMAEVHEARQRQIAEKAARRAADVQEGMEERTRLIEEEAAMTDLETEYRARLQRDALRQRLDVQAKAAYKAEQKHIEQTEKVKERARLLDAEARYRAKVHEASEYTPPVYFGRPKVQWFY